MAKVTITIEDIEGDAHGADIKATFDPPITTDKTSELTAAQRAAMVMVEAVSPTEDEKPAETPEAK